MVGEASANLKLRLNEGIVPKFGVLVFRFETSNWTRAGARSEL